MNSRLFFKKKFLCFIIIGSLATLLELLLLYSFTEFANFWYVYSSILAFSISSIFNFYLNKLVTFKNKSHKHFIQITAFFSIALNSLLLNTLIIYFLVEFVDIWYIYSKIFSAIVILFLNYFLNSKITFGRFK